MPVFGKLADDGALFAVGAGDGEVEGARGGVQVDVVGDDGPAQGASSKFIDDGVGLGEAVQGYALAADFAAILLQAQVRVDGHAVTLQSGRLLALDGGDSGTRGAGEEQRGQQDGQARRCVWRHGIPLLE